MEANFLPPHLRKYVVEQNYEKYTPVDQAVWRYILRQLKVFLTIHAHECYLEGLEKTGISVEQIPNIKDISRQLQKFGWRALPVSGFIPPAAFMELQSFGVLPIASDMRTLEHLLYTPAPDIVHEAAGHAPILVNREFSNYLRRYAEVAKKAIISKEDLEVYEAIRELSDIKENPSSTSEQIAAAEKYLDYVGKNISHISEAAELSRMNWWTAEYGLIGDINNPKIFGAGLLSSAGESKWCLSEKVKKIPLSVDCIKMSYDITEPQPQLFVTPDFETLSIVLDQMAQKMAFKTGGLQGINKAIQAQSVNTVELNSGIQISGQIIEAISDSTGEIAYLRLQGPSQLSVADKELTGQGKDYHPHGFGTPIGFIAPFDKKCPSNFTNDDWKKLNIEEGNSAELNFTSGIKVVGTVISITKNNTKNIMLSLTDARVTFGDQVLFMPEWGTFDMALGSTVTSVFGGPADRQSFGELTDFVAKRVPTPNYSKEEQTRHSHYGLIRQAREANLQGDELLKQVERTIAKHLELFPSDWLLVLEAYELLKLRIPQSVLCSELEGILSKIAKTDEKTQGLIEDGLKLVGAL